MSITLTQLRTRTRAECRDDAGTFITDTDILNWANEAQEELALRLLNQTETAAGTTSGNTLAIPSGFIRNRQLLLGTDDEVEFVADDVFTTWRDSGEDPGRTIAIYHDLTIVMYPTPDTGTAYTWWFYEKPADLSAGGDTSELPNELHNRILYFCIWRAALKEQNFQLADRYQAKYEDGLPGYSHNGRMIPGPITISPVGNYFDSSTYLK